MKLQLTTIAAALSLTMAMSVSAAGRAPDYAVSELPVAVDNFAGSGIFVNQEAKRSSMDGYTQSGGVMGRVSVETQQAVGVFTSSGNTAVANQHNTDQYSKIVQTNNIGSSADVRQGQGGNTEKNESIVRQGNAASQSSGLKARVRQVGNGGYNDSYISQIGRNHSADVLQRDSEYSDSIIYQRGQGGHMATVKQINNADQTWSFIHQSGDVQHVATVLQDNADLSASYIIQGNGGGGGGVGHMATVRQVNEAQSLSMIRQNTYNGGAATATHTQTGGSDNTAISFQW